MDPSWAFHKYEAFTTPVESGAPAARAVSPAEPTELADQAVGLPGGRAAGTALYDHVYAYAPTAAAGAAEAGAAWGAEDWAAAAQLAQHQQYQALFEGFAAHAFEW